jgi:hypothetical protein
VILQRCDNPALSIEEDLVLALEGTVLSDLPQFLLVNLEFFFRLRLLLLVTLIFN